MHMHNRKPTVAPYALCDMTKAALADLVWELAATHPGCTSCDNEEAVWSAIRYFVISRDIPVPKSLRGKLCRSISTAKET